MPRATEPGIKIPIVLDYDADKDPQPTFYIQSLSLRQNRDLAAMVDKVADSENAAQLHDRISEVLKKVLIDWENMGHEFDPEAIEDILTFHEARELMEKVLYAQTVTAEDKKKYE